MTSLHPLGWVALVLGKRVGQNVVTTCQFVYAQSQDRSRWMSAVCPAPSLCVRLSLSLSRDAGNVVFIPEDKATQLHLFQDKHTPTDCSGEQVVCSCQQNIFHPSPSL